MDSEALFEALFAAGLVALGVLSVARWSVARSREASWNETPLASGRPCARRSGGWLSAAQALVAVSLGALVLLRYCGVWPRGGAPL